MIESIEETIAHHRWCADNCEGEVRDEHLQMVAWLEELVELRVWNSEFGCPMNDYNRGALPDPCLRLDYGFGEQWASVELGDGTGYVRLTDYERLKAENMKLKELCKDMWRDVPKTESCGWDADANCCTGSDECAGECGYWYRMRELGIEVGE